MANTTYHVATLNANGRKYIITKDGLFGKSKCKTYGNIVGYKFHGQSVHFTYEQERIFQREAVTIERDVEITQEFILTLQDQYFEELRENGKEVFRTTGAKAKNQKYIIRQEIKCHN